MLSPDLAASRVILIIALVALIALLTIRAISKGRTEFQRFKKFERTRNRQRMLRKWLIESFLLLGGLTVVLLILDWQYIPLFLGAVDQWPVGVWFGAIVASANGAIQTIAGLLAAVLVVGTVVAVYLVRKTDDIPTIGDISALLPRNRSELGYGVALSLNAGLVEELLFRCALPVLVFGATGNALVAVIVSVLLFGGLHIYQGWPGIIGAIVIGAMLMTLYLATGSILVAIIAHALIDLRSLALIPVLVYRVHRVSAV